MLKIKTKSSTHYFPRPEGIVHFAVWPCYRSSSKNKNLRMVRIDFPQGEYCDLEELEPGEADKIIEDIKAFCPKGEKDG